MNVLTVAFYCSVSGIVLVTVPNKVHCVNRQRTPALGTVKGNEPSFTAAVTLFQVEVALKDNAESSRILLLVKNTILQNN